MPANSGVAKTFGENLVAARRQVRLSQEELGHLAGLHRTEIGMLEQGHRTARIDTLMKLSGSLEATPNDLLDRIAWVPHWPKPGAFVIATSYGWVPRTRPPTSP